MGKPPYDDPDTLDLMRANAHDVELTSLLGGLGQAEATPSQTVLADGPPADWFDVPADAIALSELHFHLE